MWTTYLCDPHVLARVRTTPAAPYLEGFVQELEATRYVSRSIQHLLQAAAHFSYWLQHDGARLDQIEGSTLARFRDHLSACDCGGPGLRPKPGARLARGAEVFVRYLVRAGVISPAAF